MKIQGIQRHAIFAAIVISFAAMAWMVTVPVRAQTTTGSIYGAVGDETGAVIPNVTVTAKNVQNGFMDTVRSNGAGDYVFPNLAPGNYTVSAQAAGFKSTTETGIVLDANQNVHVIFKMPIGATSETVAVTASTTLVDTRESQLGSTIDQKRLQNLPIVGGSRDSYDLVQLSPGITSYSENANSPYVGDPAGATFSTNGIWPHDNSFYLDGADNRSVYRPGGNYAPNPDALQEFRVLSSNFDAEFGDMPGAVVNMITRSGSNDFHGELYDFDRNNIFSTTSEFIAGPPTHLRQNQFGGTAGGPVLHNKLFFFFSYQGLRIATDAVLPVDTGIMPTGPGGSAAGDTAGASPGGERNGDFSTDKVIPKCGAKTYPCPGTPGNPNTTAGIIPAAYLDPVAVNIVKQYLPVPAAFNGTSGGPTPQQTANEPVTSNQYLGRGDYQLTDKHRLTFMYFHESGSQLMPVDSQPILDYAGTNITDSQTNEIATDTWVISPTKLNSLRAYYSGNHYLSAEMFPGQGTLQQLGIAIPCAALPCNQPAFKIPGYWAGDGIGNGQTAPNFFFMTAVGLGDTFDWTHGNHTLKLGVTAKRSIYDTQAVGQRAGVNNISGYATGNPLADFMLGKSATFLQSNSPNVDTHQLSYGLFAQDDWRIMHRLTLNLGVRWEVFPPFAGQHNTGTLEPNVQSTVFPSAPTGVLYNGDAGVPDGILQTSYDRFAPRVGFAYDVFGNGNTSVRGGFGLFYTQIPAGQFGQLLSPIYNLSISLADTTNFVNPYTGSTVPVDPFPYTPNLANPVFTPGISYTAMPPNNKSVPYAMEYNLTVEHQFGASWGASASYVGNGMRHLYTIRDENAPVYSPSCTVATCQTGPSELARRPYKPTSTSYVFNAIDELDPEVMTQYNSLQLGLNKRFSKHFSINANYVWSKDMSDGTDETSVLTTTLDASNEYSFHSDYGKAAYDQPQAFHASYLWVSPDIHKWGYLGKEVMSGWSFNGITTLAAGLPINILSGADTNYDGQSGADRPDQVGNPSLGGGRSRAQKAAEYFNTTAFASVPVGTATGLGTTQHNSLLAPGTVETDLSASKTFPIWRENAVQFRADSYNLFRNVNLGAPNTTMSSASFGKITSAAPGRVVELALKYSF